MPIAYLRSLTARQRTAYSNRQLAGFLCFVAGAANAGGFLAVKQYTSHMSGIVSAMADDLVLGNVALLLQGLGAFLSFLLGAACSAITINWARRTGLRSEYALPLVLEAGLLLCFGLMGAQLGLKQWLFVPATVMLLCFMMGLQNAMITKVSNAEIRTTHVTGMVTDIGIELGKLCYWNWAPPLGNRRPVTANHTKLRMLSLLVGLFFGGGVVGALAFNGIGYTATIPLAALLLLVALVPVLDDVLPRLFLLLRARRLARRSRRWGRRR